MSDSRLLVPALDVKPWPTLGPEVCDFIEDNLCHGPGDLIGQPKTLSDEERLFVYRAYEMHPRGSKLEGRRRFRRCAYSRRKGVAKTELAALIAIAECDPTAPVRFDGWDAHGNPIGRPVVDPYIPMLAYTEEQVEELAFRAVYEILSHCALGDGYDLTLERITPKDSPGRIVPIAGSPSARDGARTTFESFDEPHRMTSERQRQAVATMLRNLPKRKAADPWAMESSTMYGPGEGSVFEDTHIYALAISRGEIKDPTLLFDHRQASEDWDLGNDRELRAAIIEASGDAAEWADIDGIIGLFRDPTLDEDENRRYWLNQRRRTSKRWGVVHVWDERANPKREVLERDGDYEGEPVVLMFDGSYNRDSTALVGATVEEHPHVFVIAAWEKPLLGGVRWRVSRNDVIAEIELAMERFDVVEFACDPPGWHREVEDLEEKYGETIVRFETNQPKRMGAAVDDFEQMCRDAALTHDGSDDLARHLRNCVPFKRGIWTLVTKEHPDSPDKIDLAIGAIVATHRARWHFTHADDDIGGFVIDLTQ